MPRISAGKRMELESFWRAHLDGWRRSDLNQREYCELHGLPLKRFGNWRAKFRHEDEVPRHKLLYRRGGGLNHMSGPMANKEISSGPAVYVPSAGSTPPGGRRRFSTADKRRIVEQASRPGASVSSVARQYGIDTSLLFRWKRDLEGAQVATTFLPVTIKDTADQPAKDPSPALAAAPVIVERTAPGIEVELIGGRRVRFAHDVDPQTVHRLVALLEEDRS